MSEFPAERTVVITGAVSPRGIGRYTASYPAERGWNVGVIDVDHMDSVQVAKELKTQHRVRAEIFGANVADVQSVDQAGGHPAPDRGRGEQRGSQLARALSRCHVAGVAQGALDQSRRRPQRDPSCRANPRSRRSWPYRQHLLSVGPARWRNVRQDPYSASKAAVVGLTRSLARELGQFDITVNAISPGPVDTDITGGTLSDGRKDGLVNDLITNRTGTPQDIRAATAFLIGEESGYITGQTLKRRWRTLHALMGLLSGPGRYHCSGGTTIWPVTSVAETKIIAPQARSRRPSALPTSQQRNASGARALDHDARRAPLTCHVHLVHKKFSVVHRGVRCDAGMRMHNRPLFDLRVSRPRLVALSHR